MIAITRLRGGGTNLDDSRQRSSQLLVASGEGDTLYARREEDRVWLLARERLASHSSATAVHLLRLPRWAPGVLERDVRTVGAWDVALDVYELLGRVDTHDKQVCVG